MKAAIKYISRIKCVRWLVSVLGYITNYLSLTRKARLRKTAIQKNHSIVKPFQKALYQRSNISFGKSKIVTKTDSIVSFIDSYEAEMVRPVKLANIQTTSNEPILLCVVKDDLRRVKAQLPHYRGIGVRHFAYIDNESTDGTFDLLREQDDVSLFSVSETYGASKQRAWYRQATDMLGYDRWYLVVDSDEFFVYPGIESIPLTQYIDFLESKDIEAILAPMIDMYSDKRIFSDTHELDFRSEYSWFDTDTYVNYRLYHMQHIDGGPRYRISAGYVLSKYPLLKMKKSYLVGDHCNFPHRLNFQTKEQQHSCCTINFWTKITEHI